MRYGLLDRPQIRGRKLQTALSSKVWRRLKASPKHAGKPSRETTALEDKAASYTVLGQYERAQHAVAGAEVGRLDVVPQSVFADKVRRQKISAGPSRLWRLQNAAIVGRVGRNPNRAETGRNWPPPRPSDPRCRCGRATYPRRRSSSPVASSSRCERPRSDRWRRCRSRPGSWRRRSLFLHRRHKATLH